MAETNASDWEVDEMLVGEFNLDVPAGICTVRFTYSASGDQEPDRMFFGTTIGGEGSAIISNDGTVEFKDLSASVVHDDIES